jgi:hypothetical protein
MFREFYSAQRLSLTILAMEKPCTVEHESVEKGGIRGVIPVAGEGKGRGMEW